MKRLSLLLAIVLALFLVQPAFASHFGLSGTGAGGDCEDYQDQTGDEDVDCVDGEFDLGSLNPNIKIDEFGNFVSPFCDHLPTVVRPIMPTETDTTNLEEGEDGIHDVYVIAFLCSYDEDGSAGYSRGEAPHHGPPATDGNGMSDHAPGHTQEHGASELATGQSSQEHGNSDNNTPAASSNSNNGNVPSTNGQSADHKSVHAGGGKP